MRLRLRLLHIPPSQLLPLLLHRRMISRSSRAWQAFGITLFSWRCRNRKQRLKLLKRGRKNVWEGDTDRRRLNMHRHGACSSACYCSRAGLWQLEHTHTYESDSSRWLLHTARISRCFVFYSPTKQRGAPFLVGCNKRQNNVKYDQVEKPREFLLSFSSKSSHLRAAERATAPSEPAMTYWSWLR